MRVDKPTTRRANKLSLAQFVTILLAALSIKQFCLNVLSDWLGWTLTAVLFIVLWIVGNRFR